MLETAISVAAVDSSYATDVQRFLRDRSGKHQRVEVILVEGAQMTNGGLIKNAHVHLGELTTSQVIEGFQNALYLAKSASMDRPSPAPPWLASVAQHPLYSSTFTFGSWDPLDGLASTGIGDG